VTNGTLLNAAGATITALPGFNGPRTLGAQLDNQGTLAVALNPGRLLTLARASAAQLNSGTIDLSGGDLTVTLSGTTPSFTTSGAVNIGTNDTLTISGGQFSYNGTALGGPGTLVLSGVRPAVFGAAHAVASILATSSTLTFATPQSTGATGFLFTSDTINGPGSLTNDVGRTLALRSTIVNTPLDNQGTLTANGTSVVNDTLTTGTSSRLRVQGNGTFSSASLTVAKGFENAGIVELTDTTSSYGATLTVPNGALVNLAGASINALAGANGPRTLAAALDNQGALSVALAPGRDLVMNRANSAHTNSGTIDISGGDLTIAQTGAGGSFSSVGAITVGGGDTLTISGKTFGYVGGTLDGPGGTLVLSGDTAVFSKPHSIGSIVLSGSSANFSADDSTARTKLLLTTSTINGAGTLTNSPGKTLSIRGSSIGLPFVNQGTLLANGTSSIDGPLTTVAGSTLRVQGNGTFSSANLTVTNGLVNNGAIELTDTTSSYGATLVVKTLPLVNAGTIDILAGAGGPRTIDAILLDNQGTFTASQAVTISHADAQHTNRGTYKVKAGTVTFAQSGTNESFTNQAGGIIDMDPGTTFRVTNGPVTNALGGKIVGFGTLDVRNPATLTNNGDFFPGASPGALSVSTGTGTASFGSSASLNIELAGVAQGTQYDYLPVTGSASWAGTLNVTLSFAPTSGQQFVIAQCSVACTNRFGVENLPPGWQPASYVGNRITLTAP
jgi:hypothetical protein